MARVRGSIQRRNNGRFTAITAPQRSPDGRVSRKSLGTYTSEAEALAALAGHDHRTRIERSGLDERRSMRLSDWLAVWVGRQQARAAAGSLARRTASEYANTVRLHIHPLLGKSLIRDLDADQLEAFQWQLKSRGLSDQSVLKVWRTLR